MSIIENLERMVSKKKKIKTTPNATTPHILVYIFPDFVLCMYVGVFFFLSAHFFLIKKLWIVVEFLEILIFFFVFIWIFWVSDKDHILPLHSEKWDIKRKEYI